MFKYKPVKTLIFIGIGILICMVIVAFTQLIFNCFAEWLIMLIQSVLGAISLIVFGLAVKLYDIYKRGE